MTRFRLACFLAAAAFFAGCGQRGEDVPSKRPELVSAPHVAPLSRALPAETVAYFRIPSLADWLFEPDHSGLNNARALDANRAAASAILNGLRDNVFGAFDAPPARLGAFLVTGRRAPLEIAVLASASGAMIPDVLIRTELDGYTGAELMAMLGEAAEGALTVGQPFDDSGYGMLMVSGLPVHAQYDGAVLYLHGGLSATVDRLKAFAAGSHESISVLADFERKIDHSGRHIAAWLDVDRLWPTFAQTADPEQIAALETAGVNQIDFVWAGNASRNGRAETVLHLAMPKVGFRQLLPTPALTTDLDIATPVRSAARVVLPSRAEWDAAEAWVLGLMGDEARADWEQGLSEINAALGRDVKSLLDGYGPDIAVVSDGAGWWAGYRLRDASIHAGWEQFLAEKGWVVSRERSMAGLALTEMKMVGNPFMDAEEMAGAMPPEAVGIFNRLSAPIFYHTDGQYLIGANIPQILAVRDQTDQAGLDTWLAGHDLDWSQSILAAATEVENSPRDVYHLYLYLLGYLGNLANADVDLTTFPTAPALGVGAAGRLGLRLDSGADGLSFHFSYETSAAEALLNMDLMTLYLVGVGAAIAIPAYQEYTGMGAGGGDNSCAFANDGECDEPDICEAGTDTNDCGGVSGGPNSCPFAFDGACDEPDICPAGTDTADCSGEGGAGGPDSCTFAHDGACDEPDLCASGTDTTDCSNPGGPDSCAYANDGACDEPGICNPGTDTTDCATPPEPDSCAFANDGECDEPDICRVGSDTTDCAATEA